MDVTRRTALAAIAAAPMVPVAMGPARAAKPYDPPGSLLDAARKEGGFTLFSATFPEVQQEVINAFNKRFPFVKVRFVRASGGQLITRQLGRLGLSAEDGGAYFAGHGVHTGARWKAFRAALEIGRAHV